MAEEEFPEKWNFRPPRKVAKAGAQATRKVSSKHFKPRTAHEKRLLKPKAKLDDEEEYC